MASIWNVWLQWITIINCLKLFMITTATKISLTTPVNPVKEEGMLALHCHIIDLTENQLVTIYRGIGKTYEELSYGDGILNSADERSYIARRVLTDGSVVYFLSIMDIVRSDQGTYTCEVLERSDKGLARMAIDSVDVDVSFFPREQYPLCSVQAPKVIYSGTRIALNCTTEQAFPDVTITWKRTRTNDVVAKSRQINENGISYSVLYLDISLRDNDDMFLCEIKSDRFPDKAGSCHVGPLTVIANPKGNTQNLESNPDSVSNDLSNAVTTELNLFNTQMSKVSEKEQCQRTCDLKAASNIQIWRSATVIAAIVAFVLLVIGIIIYWRICKEMAKRRERLSQRLPPSRQPMDCLYEELKYRQDPELQGSKVYMALVRPRKPDSLAVGLPVSNMLHTEGNYTLTPTTYNVAINNNN